MSSRPSSPVLLDGKASSLVATRTGTAVRLPEGTRRLGMDLGTGTPAELTVQVQAGRTLEVTCQHLTSECTSRPIARTCP